MATAEKPKYKVIGTRPIRHDGVDKVTGAAKYGADIRLSGMLHAIMLRSPHAHAKINSIDTSRAEALPGVHAIVTNTDLPEQGDRVVELELALFPQDHRRRARDRPRHRVQPEQRVLRHRIARLEIPLAQRLEVD